MGACSKKLSKRDSHYHEKTTPDLQVRTEDSNYHSASHLPQSKPDPTDLLPRIETDQSPLRPVSKGISEISDSHERPVQALIHHYEDQNDLLKRYNLSPEDDRNPYKKKSMIVQNLVTVQPIAARNEEGSFESSGSIAEGVVGTVH